jgi:hypothetical protein
MANPMRRNLAHLAPAEQQAFVDAVRQIDLLAYVDGVSYWDKQDQIHQGTHNHGGPSFIPWHRELCNRFEKLLQQVNPDVALHYWDWTTDPRNSPDGNGGTVNLCTDTLMGTANGLVAGTLAPLHNNDVLAGSRDATMNPVDPPQAIERNCAPGAPGVASDATIINGADALPQADQWPAFRVALEGSHNTAHGFFGPGSNIDNPHASFEDPFVFLLHSNVDRLFAQWQTQPGQEWRLDPNLVYGSESNTADPEGILHNLQPWDGTVEFGAAIPPWTGGSSEIEVKNCRHPSVVAPPCYDTLPLTVTQVAPTPGQPMRFLDVTEGEQTARALRLRVRGCRQVVCNASLSGDPAFTLLAASVSSPEPDAFETNDVLVWVLFAPGSAGQVASGTLQVDVPETGDTFTIPIEANVIAKPTVASSLVLDRSGSMDLPSGVAAATRMEILRSAAPLFVNLLDDADGVGVVRFDTDAAEAVPVQVAGGQIGGVGRTNALNAITTHTTNPAGLTAIGDGLEAAVAQLGVVAGAFEHQATVVFTDGHETAPKFISDVADLISSRVFAIGLGTAEQLNPVALNNLVDGTGGYLLLTGNPGPDDQILLQKYFAQVLAGVTNAQIVVDPDGFVPIGGIAAVPYTLTEADTRTDVIVLSTAADALDVKLEAPDGSVVDGTSGATLVTTENFQTLRLSLPTPSVPGPTAGTWVAHLSVDQRGLNRWRRRLEERQDRDGLIRLRAHGVPFTLTVQARSGLRMAAAVTQDSRRPGATAVVTATLTQAGIPLAHMAVAHAMVTDPSGAVSTIQLGEVADGVFRGAVAMPVPGVYRILVRAEGATLHGVRFSREELRTVGVWSRGDEQSLPGTGSQQTGPDWCGLLTCLLDDAVLGRIAAQRRIDVDRLRDCVKRHCR